LKWKPGASVCVVAASGGYPGKFEAEKEIRGLTDLAPNSGVKVLHAGTKRTGDKILTAGGRVIGVTAADDSLATVLGKVYAAIDKIKFDGMHFRCDIGTSSQCVDVAGA
jgi:phosphoribosylamine--glycine ligase